MSRRSRKVQRGFETLESRLPMAGNITATLVGNDLVITGDAQSNALAIVGTANAGEFVVTGINDGDGVATNINGVPNDAVTISGVLGNLLITLAAGDDQITISDADVPADLVIDLGDGHDAAYVGLLLQPVTVGNDLTVHTAEGADYVSVTDVALGRDLLIDATATANRAIPHYYELANVYVGRDATLVLGNRGGSMTIERTTVVDDLTLDNFSDRSSFAPYTNYPRFGDAFVVMSVTNSIIEGDFATYSRVAAQVSTEGVYVGGLANIVPTGPSNAIYLSVGSFAGQLIVNTTNLESFGGGFLFIPSNYDYVALSGIVGNTASMRTSGDLRIAYSGFADDVVLASQKFNTVTSYASAFANDLNVSFLGEGGVLEITYSTVTGEFIFDNRASPLDYGHGRSGDLYSSTTIYASRIATARFVGGLGTDVMHVNYSVLDHIYVNLLHGSDGASLIGTLVNYNAQFDLGQGFDAFTNRYNRLNGFVLANVEYYVV
jgi:hypothetical protein